MSQHSEGSLIDAIQHLWPVISGLALTFVAVFRLWWHDRRETKKRIGTLEVMAEHMVTKADLRACREDVRDDHEESLEKIYNEIKTNNSENAQQHQDIMAQMIRLHSPRE